MAQLTLEEMKPELQAIYRENATARALFDELGRLHRIDSETEAAWLSEASGLEYSDLITTLRRLDEIGVGHFIVGRKQRKTRFEWNIPAMEAARTAMGPGANSEIALAKPVSNIVEPGVKVETSAGEFSRLEADSAKVSASAAITHTYALRAELVVRISLPTNLTRNEAERLSQWIKSLPFDDS